MKRLWTSIIFLTLGFALFAQVQFGGLSLSQDNQLLFTARAEAPRFGAYTTAFSAKLDDDTLTQLSFFPEDLSLLGSGIQIQNRFGVFRSGADYASLEPVAKYPSFVGGGEVQTGKINPLVTSPNGRWLTFLRRTSPAFGDLILVEVATGDEFTVSSQVEVNLAGPVVSWSPESDFFMYHKNNKIFYFSIDQHTSDRLLSEDFRSLGAGQISSVYWGKNNELYYISGSLVYQVLGIEFFTRSLYQEFLKIGTIVGSIPFNFDPNFDRFWISPDGTQLLLDKGGRNVYLYFLQNNDFANNGRTIQLPYLFLPRNSRVAKVLWSSKGLITILTQSLAGGSTSSGLYRLDTSTAQNSYQFQAFSDATIQDIVLSPREEKAAILRANGVEIRNYQTWQTEKTLAHPSPLHAIFLSDTQVLIAGSSYGETVDISGAEPASRFLFHSQLDTLGFGKNSGAVTAIQGGVSREYDSQTKTWTALSDAAGTAEDLSPAQAASGDFRVYLENLSSGSYRNMIMVRNIRNIGTVSLFDPPLTRYEAFPAREDAVNFDLFQHGSRIRRREVSLVFNAINSVEGLTTILNTLQEYEVRATFFLNGDFIRRHPGAVQEIADSGHEVGSLFTVYFDMADSRYQITSQFIRQGLARNEDEYYEATGRELSLLWHAPYYFTNPTILEAGKATNYTYVGRDVDSLDWVPKRDETGISRLYYPSAELIESVLERKKPGSIISMTVGRPADDRPDGGRDDYLFLKLDILLNNLIERGYTMVPVSTLMDRAK